MSARTRLALAALLALFALWFTAAAQVELEPRVFEIAGKLRCPVCVSETVAQSAAGTSVRMRELIAEKLAAGESEQAILAYFQARYGDWILLDPPKRGLNLLVWLLPAVAAGFGVLLLALVVRRWLNRARTPATLDESERARLREAMGGEH